MKMANQYLQGLVIGVMIGVVIMSLVLILCPRVRRWFDTGEE